MTYHVKSDDIFKGDLARTVPLDEDLVDDLRTTPGRKAKDKGLVFGRLEGLNTTDDIFCNIFADGQRILPDNYPPRSVVSQSARTFQKGEKKTYMMSCTHYVTGPDKLWGAAR